MLRLRIDQILQNKKMSKYALFKKLEPMSYQNFNKIYLNQTTSIKFSTLQKIKEALDVSYDELFEEIPDE